MGSGRGKQRRAQASISEELADWLGELPNQLGAVVDTLPDGREKDALRGALAEVTERNVPEAQEELRSGKHDELLEGQKALKRAELAGAAAAWEEAQKELALIPKLRRIGVMTAEPGDKILGIGSEAQGENELVLNEGQKQIMESVLADSLSSLDPARPEVATLQGLQEKIADLTEAGKALAMSEDEVSVFNQLFRVLDCPDGVGPIQEAIDLFREEVEEDREADPEYAEEADEIETTLGLVEKDIAAAGVVDQPCLIIVDIADAKMVDVVRAGV